MPYYRQKKVLTNRALTRKVREMENEPELKFKDTKILPTNLDMINHVVSGTPTPPTIYPIGLVGQGTDARARIGDFIRATSLKIRLRMRYLPNTNISPQAHVRMIIYYDANPQGATTQFGTVNSLLDNDSSDQYVLQHYNYSEMGVRYKVLYDKIHTFNSTSDYGTLTDDLFPSASSKYIKKTIKLGRKTIYSGADALASNVQSNGLYVVWFFYAEGTNEDQPQTISADSCFRMYYKDE